MKRAAAVLRLRRVCAAAVLGGALFLVPTDFASAQTNTCDPGETATSNSGVNSGTCVPTAEVDVANACEAAGWSLAQHTNGDWLCRIRWIESDDENIGPPNYSPIATGDSCGIKSGCAKIFADVSSFPPVQVSMGITLNSDTDTRQFWYKCPGGDQPSGKNDAGQTQCCAPPKSDFDMNPDTACEEPAPVSACQNGGGCPANSFCQEQQGGGAECVCNPTYRGGTSGATAFAPNSGTVCEDTNECVNETAACGVSASCTNTVGSHSCACFPGNEKTPGQPDTDPQCRDADECGTTLNNCNDNGQCRKVPNGVDFCKCDSGWEGDSCTDRVVVTVNLSAGAGGAAAAKTADDPDVGDGGTVSFGAAVTFTATPDNGFYVSRWTGCGSPSANTGGHTDGGEKTCATAADKNPLEVSVAFADIDECEVPTIRNNPAKCHSGATCENDVDNPGADPICECGPGTTGDGITCFQDRTVQLRPGSGGTIVASDGDGEVGDGDVVHHGTTITFTARPDPGYYVLRWGLLRGSLTDCGTPGVNFGSPSDPGEKSCEAVAGRNLAAGLPVRASVTFSDIDECATNDGGCVNGECVNEEGGFDCACESGWGGELCDSGLPKAEMTVPAGRDIACDSGRGLLCSGVDGFGACATPETGSSGETGSAGRKSCVSSGTGEVTVGVYFDCGP